MLRILSRRTAQWGGGRLSCGSDRAAALARVFPSMRIPPVQTQGLVGNLCHTACRRARGRLHRSSGTAVVPFVASFKPLWTEEPRKATHHVDRRGPGECDTPAV